MGLGRNEHRQRGLLARNHDGGNIKNSAGECAFNRAEIFAVHPRLRRIVDSIEVQPDFFSGIGRGNREDRPIPTSHHLPTYNRYNIGLRLAK